MENIEKAPKKGNFMKQSLKQMKSFDKIENKPDWYTLEIHSKVDILMCEGNKLKALLLVKNYAPNLTTEELSKLIDSFYRTNFASAIDTLTDKISFLRSDLAYKEKHLNDQSITDKVRKIWIRQIEENKIKIPQIEQALNILYNQ